MSYFHYSKFICITSLLLIFVVALFNYAVNPFSIFESARVLGVNYIKPQSANRIAVFKKYQSIYFQPKTILVGNSRVEMGLNPEHIALSGYQPVYNLGVPGPAVRAQLSYAQHVVDNSNIETIILALDFRDFLDQQRVKHSKLTPLEINEFEDKIAALLSLDSLKASVATILSQKDSVPNRLPNGFNPANEYREIINLEGQDALFEHQIRLLNSKLEGKQYDSNKIQIEILILDKKITEWISNDIEVMLFINPYHADYYTTLEKHSLLSSFNHWRGLIVSIFSPKINYCDFTPIGYEKSYDKLNENELKYFWEPTHYKRELGDIMIPMILNGCSGNPPPN